MQIANFILTGLFYSWGWQTLDRMKEKKTPFSLLIALVGIGLTGAGVFVTDPLFGYTKNKPLMIQQYTCHGHLYDAFSMLVFICLPWACFVFARRCRAKGQKSGQLYSLLTNITNSDIYNRQYGFRKVEILKNVDGLFQRVCIAAGLLSI